MAERVRIRRIQVSNLFGIFNHDIPLRTDDRITIVHGPNGYGKTIILEMIHGLFSSRWDCLRRVPFDELRVELEDESVIRVKHGARASEGKRSKKRRPSLIFSFERPGFELETFTHVGQVADEESPEHTGRRALASWAEADLSRFQRWRLRQIQLPLTFGELTPSMDLPDDRGEEPEWLKSIRQRIRVRLIHTKRLGVIGDQKPAVERCSEELAASIGSSLAAYASRSQELDSTFLDRLFRQEKSALLPMEVLEQRLRRIEATRMQLISLGFLDPEPETHKSLPKLDKSKLDVLTVYVHDTESKLAVFEALARKAQLLTDAINKRFQYKKLFVSKEMGFIFRSAVGDAPLPLSSLSSGEQHELVLFYELLFKVEPNALVLIDEPELSLHLAWQQKFLDDLVQMVKLSSFDVLVATHSPAIIGKRWDLTVELKGPEPGNGKQ